MKVLGEFTILIGLILMSQALSATSAVAAQELEGHSVAAETMVSEDGSARPQHTFQIAAGFHRFDYEEAPPPPKKSTEKGTLPSVALGYRFEEDPQGTIFLARIEGSYAAPTHYLGTDQSGKNAIADTTHNRFIEAEAEFATPPVALPSSTEIRAYGGGGYHFWQRGADPTAAGGYREDYRWPLVIAGVLVSSHPFSRMSLDLDVSARMQLGGKMKVYLSQISEQFQDATVNLGSRVGGKAQLPMSFRLYGKISFLLSPWAEFSSIGASDPVAILAADGSPTGLVVSEPSSRTIQYGSLMGFTFGI